MQRNCFPPGPSQHCIPGCTGGQEWCEVSASDYCPWRGGTHLRYMAQQLVRLGAGRYNEVIIDGRVFETNAPRSIEAIFSQGSAPQEGSEAHTVHRLLVEHFRGIAGGAPPLLTTWSSR
eukprot:6625199-Prymnesium_polylepis.1